MYNLWQFEPEKGCIIAVNCLKIRLIKTRSRTLPEKDLKKWHLRNWQNTLHFQRNATKLGTVLGARWNCSSCMLMKMPPISCLIVENYPWKLQKFKEWIHLHVQESATARNRDIQLPKTFPCCGTNWKQFRCTEKSTYTTHHHESILKLALWTCPINYLERLKECLQCLLGAFHKIICKKSEIIHEFENVMRREWDKKLT